MYSSRSYHRRNKSYYRKKRINRKFSPALYKHDIPTFFQQKGRILQTTPLRMYPIPTQLPNTKTLENMYNTLLKAKYPNVGPQPSPEPDPPLQSYVVSFNKSFNDLYSLENNRLTNSYFPTLVTSSAELTPLPAGWDYRFDLYNIQFRQGIAPNYSSETQFHIDLVSPILSDSNPYQFVIKSVTTSGGSSGLSLAWVTTFIPVSANQAKLTRCTYTTSSFNVQQQTVSTTDNNITDNGWYPLLSTDFDPAEGDNYIQFTLNSGDAPTLYMTFTVLCTPIESF